MCILEEYRSGIESVDNGAHFICIYLSRTSISNAKDSCSGALRYEEGKKPRHAVLILSSPSNGISQLTV